MGKCLVNNTGDDKNHLNCEFIDANIVAGI